MTALLRYLTERKAFLRRIHSEAAHTEVTLLLRKLDRGELGELVELEPVTYTDRAESLLAGAKRLQMSAAAERHGLVDVKASLAAARKAVGA